MTYFPLHQTTCFFIPFVAPCKPLLHLLDTTSLDCRKAISSEIGDYEDAIMVETAIRSEMDCIVTRNVKDYMKSSVKVCEPSALLKLLEEENETE